MERPIHVRAPATSANLGPAFDAAGIALDWWDELEARPAPVDGIQLSGEQAELLPTGRDNLIRVAMRRLAQAAGTPLPPLHLSVVKGFPLGRGFGSSAAAVVLGLVAARRLVAPDLPEAELLALACELEGHPDNATPCLHGGATLAWVEDGRPRRRALPVHPDLVAVALVAPEPMATSEARRLLPERVPFAVAAHTGARAAMLPLALAGDHELLLPATEDLLHQPERLAHTPDGAKLLERLRSAGHAAFVSGAGPSLLVLCPRPAAAGVVADAEEALAADGAEGWSVRPLELARHGAL
ncbi:MAG TPA: homoserine kinase [Actinomycetota bacterium]|jgi:homoserine kinase|nr:homoserine kinase [Actinomycetota bacterium]